MRWKAQSGGCRCRSGKVQGLRGHRALVQQEAPPAKIDVEGFGPTGRRAQRHPIDPKPPVRVGQGFRTQVGDGGVVERVLGLRKQHRISGRELLIPGRLEDVDLGQLLGVRRPIPEDRGEAYCCQKQPGEWLHTGRMTLRLRTAVKHLARVRRVVRPWEARTNAGGAA